MHGPLSALFSCWLGFIRHGHPTPPPVSGQLNTQLLQRRREMEVEMQLDDDLFFAELSKRISLLITDDDESDFAAVAAAQFPTVNLPPGFSMSPHVPSSMLAPPAYTLFHHAASYGSAGDAAGRTRQQPQHQQQQQCGSKGTGVFIPRSTPGGGAHSKRKGRNWSGSKAHKARAQADAVVAAGTPVKRR